MTIYFVMLGFIILIQIIPFSFKKFINIKLLFSFLLIFIYSAIRIDYGRDYKTYEDYFNLVKEGYYLNDIEPGFILLNKILPSYRAVLVILSAFTCISLYVLFKKYILPKYHWLAFMIMALSGDKMLFFQLTGLRNAIAVNIMILSIPLIKERKLFKYLVCCACACIFHYSAIIYMPIAYFIGSPKRIKLEEIIMWSISFVLLATNIEMIRNMITKVNLAGIGKYYVYIQKISLELYERKFFLYIFVMLVTFFSFLILRRHELCENEYMIIKLSLLFTVALLLGAMDVRGSQYYMPYFLVGIIMVLNRLGSPIVKYVYLSMIGTYLYYSFFVVYLNKPTFALSDYVTIFNY